MVLSASLCRATLSLELVAGPDNGSITLRFAKPPDASQPHLS